MISLELTNISPFLVEKKVPSLLSYKLSCKHILLYTHALCYNIPAALLCYNIPEADFLAGVVSSFLAFPIYMQVTIRENVPYGRGGYTFLYI